MKPGLRRRNLPLTVFLITFFLAFGWTPSRLVGTSFTTSQTASAQEAGEVRVSSLDTQSFPRLQVHLDVRDAQRNFVYDLQPDQFTIREDEQTLPAEMVKRSRQGAQIVVAVNPSAPFFIRDAQGVSRYEYLSMALKGWAFSRSGSDLDDVTFLTPEGRENLHLRDMDTWRQAVEDYAPAETGPTPGFDFLARGLEVASDPSPRPGMGQVVLFITSLPGEDPSVGLQNLVARANQSGTRIFFWLITSAELFSSPEAQQLAAAAAQTGGALFAYSGVETVPNPEDYFEAQRNSYLVTFQSQIRSSGRHQIVLEVQSEQMGGQSSPLEFELAVAPPNVAFITPPMEITRTELESEGDEPIFSPSEQDLEVLIEFPDGHVREITRTALYVDGALVAENTQAPFDRFTWDLQSYEQDGEHRLHVEVTDSLGLSAQSMDIPVAVRAVYVQRTWLRILADQQGYLALVAAAIAGGILFLVLIFGGRMRPGALRELRKARRRKDPVTQPVPIKNETRDFGPFGLKRGLHWPQRRMPQEAKAFLVRINDAGAENSLPPLNIASAEVTFGRDPVRATQIIDDASVEGLHARLKLENGQFRLFDEGSTAGTWVNYAPVSREGLNLEHGDILHIGRLGYRFLLREPQQVRKPVIRIEA